ncbi:hypothetical protein [Oligosphaera ethanolica]|uniref:Pyruvate/2-oxoacid:ferredoxin oxidoreductase delta subunit n=1 Tax=Oligosphaera ethanolica TaxID=760260 RepID=A0AAE4AR59_9BACT|nr:hypothetical protein [Oligosphaera ethanolica]MDQ0291147.1 Pyruvate/2-oxoacid:ferredoxin oxidoreductase delta subunit [Oligosphaera ethanolica]
MARIAFCACREYGHIPAENLARLVAAAGAAGHDIEVLDDLCHCAAKDAARLASLATADAVVACHPRAVRGLFARCGCAVPAQLLNARCDSPAAMATALGLGELPATATATVLPSSPAVVAADGWIAWYPVLDYGRCVNCGQCVDFCMFGVYTRDERGVHVTQPDACKTNCPACARMCPARAIMFPKITEEPINGAEPVGTAKPAAASRPGGLMDTLRTRNAVKKRLFKDDMPS